VGRGTERWKRELTDSSDQEGNEIPCPLSGELEGVQERRAEEENYEDYGGCEGRIVVVEDIFFFSI
jgi:hypothetical protein